MTLSRAAAVAALVVAILTVARGTSCAAGGEVFIGGALAGVLAAIWNDNPERRIAGRIAKFIVVLLLVGAAILLVTAVVHVRCVPAVASVSACR
jgi:hypothetical protein